MGGKPGRGSAASSADGDLAYARALAAGDGDAARRFMAHNLPVVLGIARRLLTDAIEAEDVAQETFMRVWKHADRWKPGPARFDTWVGRIAINLCYDRLRRRREPVLGTQPEQPDPAASADARLQADATVATVRRAVAALPERQRLALELCHFQEQSNIEAAAMMEISVDALESLLSRGRRRLKAVLTGESEDLLRDLAAAMGEDE